MITVNTNMASIIAQNSLYKSTNKMNTALQRLSTGLRINSAKDDAAGSAISTKLEYKVSSYDIAKDNAQMGQSMLDTASGSLGQINSMLQRIRDLSEQASNGTYGLDERKAMQAEIDGLTEEIYRIKNTTEFNGKKILGEEEKPSMTSIPTMSINDINLENLTQAEWDNNYKGQVFGISNAKELQKLATIVNDKRINTTDTTFALTADIDLNELEMTEEGNWTAIGYNPLRFKGIFDGNGHTISNLKINKPTKDCQGLFGATAGAEIKNINLENANVVGNSHIGSLVGHAIFGTKISNCNVSAKVTSTYRGTQSGQGNTGGFIGYGDNGYIKNCTANVEVIGGRFTGGFIGNTTNTDLENCIVNGTVTGESLGTGGFIGLYNSDNTHYIKNCISKTSIINNGTTCGAFSGEYYNSGILENNVYDSTKTNFSAVGSGLQATNNQVSGLTNPYPVIYSKNTISYNTNLQVGIDSSNDSVISVDTGFSLDDFKVSVLSEFSAHNSLDKIDAMMNKITDKLTDIGSTQNRLISTMEFQEVQRQALTSANSLIKDADIALESANYIKNQILQSVTSSILATANQNPQIALQLI